jgi:hypothetical protein
MFSLEFFFTSLTLSIKSPLPDGIPLPYIRSLFIPFYKKTLMLNETILASIGMIVATISLLKIMIALQS